MEIRAEGIAYRKFASNTYHGAEERKLRLDVDSGRTLLGAVYFFRNDADLSPLAPNPLVVFNKGQSVSDFLSPKAQIIFCLKGRKGSNLCLPKRSMML